MVNVLVFKNASHEKVISYHDLDLACENEECFWIDEINMSMKYAQRYFSNYIKEKNYGCFFIEYSI